VNGAGSASRGIGLGRDQIPSPHAGQLGSQLVHVTAVREHAPPSPVRQLCHDAFPLEVYERLVDRRGGQSGGPDERGRSRDRLALQRLVDGQRRASRTTETRDPVARARSTSVAMST
jgi:hypothetical protein